MTDTQDGNDIRKQVEAMVEAEEAKRPPAPSGVPEISSKMIRDCLFMNELGDGTLYATLFRDRFLFCKNSEEWYEWTGHHWQLDVMNRSLVAVETVVCHYLEEHGRVSKEIADAAAAGEEKSDKTTRLKELRDALLKRAIALRGDRRRTSCLKFAHTIENAIAITGEEFDKKPILFPCANGVIDLKSGVLQPGRPSDYLTKASPVAFTGIDTPCPLWEKTLLEIFNGSQALVDYLRRLLGYSMTGLVSEKVFPVLYGKTGWNGRSMIMDTVTLIMGSLAHAIPSEMLMAQKFGRSSSAPSPDIMSLRGIRLAVASEIDENQSFSVARIKHLTGKDELPGRNPHDKHQTYFRQTHKLFLMTNTQPEAPAGDKAFWYRMALIPFDISFVNRDPQEPNERRADLNLDKKIMAEASGILAWLVRGVLEWQRDGLNPPREVTEATEKYRRSEDLIADWIYERANISDPHAEETATNLYKDFVGWYHNNIGQKERSGTWFGKQLGKKYEKHKSNGRVIYLGISLKNPPAPGEQGEL
jgi:putative DNA primase/helicase